MAKIPGIQSTNYRADIDGLRAFAVISVLIYHFFPSACRAGFIGVDIFFVISGYLVTGIILSDIQKNQFSFTEFYKKRALRLFPSLAAVLLFCIILGSILLTSQELKNLGLHILAGITFMENFLLYFESGYFDKNSHLKPLLHLWSLSIEEQFYLIWPLIIFLSYKTGVNFLKKTFLFIFSVSLILSLILITNKESFSFYMLPTRLWELAAGGLLLLAEANREFKFYIEKFSLKIFKFKLDIAMLGLSLIVLSFFIITNKNFPGFWALFPVVGTILIIANPKSKINIFLSHKYLVYIGLISYPLYLWHWPLLSFANIISPNYPTFYLKTLLLLISFLLAIISYECLEKPIRRNSTLRNKYSIIVFSTIFVGLAGYLITFFEGLPNRYLEIESARESVKSFRATPDTKNWKECTKKGFEIQLCAIYDSAKEPTIVMIGDSHALHLFSGLSKVYNQKGENLLLLGKSGTPPLYNVVSKANPDTSLDDAFEFVMKNKTIHTVILSAFWDSYYEDKGVAIADYNYKNTIEDKLNFSEKNQKKIFYESLVRTIEFLKSARKNIVFFYDIPALPFYLDKCLPRPHFATQSKCTFTTLAFNQPNYRTSIAEILKNDDTIDYFDPLKIMCKSNGHKNECNIWINNKIIYSNEHHLSVYGSDYLAEKLYSNRNDKVEPFKK